MQADSALLEVAAELTDCARYGEDEEIQQLLAAASSPADLANTAASNGNVALHMAAANGHTATCELLLQAGANVNIKNSAGNTPLHWGALNGHLAAVNLLLSNDASPFEMNAQMRIALDEATAGDHAEVATAIRIVGEKKVKANQEKREKARADSVQASTGTSAAAAAAEASESAAEAANLVEMDTGTEDTQPEPEPALSSTSGQIDGETVAGATNGYGTVAVDLAAEAKKAKEMKSQGLNPDGTPYMHLPGNDAPPPTAMKRNPVTGEMEEFHSEALKDDLPEEETESADIEIPTGDDY